MGTSITYRALRAEPLADTERWQIARILAEYDVDPLTAVGTDGGVVDWSPLQVDDPDPADPEAVFRGTTRLPSTSLDHMWAGIQHWCSALTAVRHLLADAEWQVAVADHPIPWDEETAQFDPSK